MEEEYGAPWEDDNGWDFRAVDEATAAWLVMHRQKAHGEHVRDGPVNADMVVMQGAGLL